jgi:hypothetical protein
MRMLLIYRNCKITHLRQIGTTGNLRMADMRLCRRTGLSRRRRAPLSMGLEGRGRFATANRVRGYGLS